MVTDIRVNEDIDIYLDSANDLATISGIEQLEQSTALDVLGQVRNFSGGRLTGESVGLLEERVQESLQSDPQIDRIISVTVSRYDKDTGDVALDVVVTENEDFTIELTL
jgi:hypothetical protein